MPATSARVAAASAGVLLLAAVVATPFTAARSLAGGEFGFAVVDLVQAVVFLGVGAVLGRGPVAAVLVAAGSVHAVSAAAYQYGMLGLSLPGATWAIWAQTWLYLPALGLVAVILPGLLAGASRRYLGGAAAVVSIHTVVLSVQPGPLLRTGELSNPLAVPAAAAALPVVAALSVVVLLAGPVLLWRRWRRSAGDDRTSLSWFLAGEVLIVVALLADLALSPAYAAVSWSLQLATLPLLPGALLAVAVRRGSGRLPVAVNHALVWSLLSLGLAWSYLLLAGWLATVLHLRAGLGVSVVAAAVVAVAFEPVRSRVQRAVDRLIYGDRRDPLTVLGQVTAHLSASAPPPPPADRAEPADQAGPAASLAADLVDRLRLAGLTVHLPGETDLHAGRVTAEPVEVALPDGGRAIAYPRPGERLTPADRDLLAQIGSQVSAAAAARRAAESLRRSRADLVSARVEERHRLSRDLHDDLGPALAGISFGLRAAANKVAAGDPDGVADLLAALGRESAVAATEIRRIAHDLHPPWLAEDGLTGALRKRMTSLDSPDGTRMTLVAPDELPELPLAVQVAAYRITVEALSNVVRHAGAAQCTVTVSAADTLKVEISDDGRGLASPRDPGLGLGLSTMRARAEELNGTLHVGPAQARGTVVRATLPVVAR